MSGIEKDLKDKSQSIGDWWNSVPSLDKEGLSGTLLVRLSDAVEGVKDVREESLGLPEIRNTSKDVKAWVDGELIQFKVDEFYRWKESIEKVVEVRVREEMVRKEVESLNRILIALNGYYCGKHMILRGILRKMIKEKERFLVSECVNEDEQLALYSTNNQLKDTKFCERKSFKKCVKTREMDNLSSSLTSRENKKQKEVQKE